MTATPTKSEELRAALRRCWNGILFAGFLSAFLNLLALTVPLYMLQIYDRVITSRSFDTLLMLSLMAVFALGVFALLDYLRARVYLILGERVARQLNASVLTAAVSEALRSKGASAQALRDLNDVRQFVASGPISATFDAACAPLFLAALFLLHPSYGFIALIALAALVGLGLLTEFFARRPTHAAQDGAIKVQMEAGAVVRGAELVEGLGMLPALARRWEIQRDHAEAGVWRGTNAVKAISSLSKATRLAIQIVMLAVGATLAIEHIISPGSMVAASIIVGRLLMPFEQLIDGWRQWANAGAAKSRLERTLAAAVGRKQSMPMEVKTGKLVVDRVSFVPPGADKPILRGVSFEVAPGEVIGIVGPSASGKSTLARLLIGAFAPSSGGVFLDGQPVHMWERESFGQQVGYLPQSVLLLDGTVRENIARFRDADPAEVVAAARMADVHEMIGRLPFGYETAVGESGFQLSGGQRQRIGLARAVFGKPKLIVLDEPNASLDGQGELALLNAIRAAKQEGATVVLIAHRPSLVTVVDRLLVLNDGVVERYGPRADVLRAITAGTNRGPVRVAPSEALPAAAGPQPPKSPPRGGMRGGPKGPAPQSPDTGKAAAAADHAEAV
jgi:ATP-binding cassette subfamily C protein